MLSVCSFSEQAIIDFCEVTLDHNVVHDPAYMKSQSKKAVVPGMLILSKAIGLAEEIIYKGANTFQLYLNSMVGANEFLTIGYNMIAETPVKAEIVARNSTDALRHRGNPSTIFKRDHDPQFEYLGNRRHLETDAAQVESFSEIVGLKGKPLGALLFSIAYASHSLFRAIEKPVSRMEREIREYLSKDARNDKQSPFYQSISIHLPDNIYVPQGGFPLDFLIHFERIKEGRTYSAQVICTQNDRDIYFSKYVLTAIPDRLIMRMAPNL
ncbi:MAG TPA: hypothetical protein PK028_08255 [Bacteroidales bacterium]|jgi:hypothetical protein|nr:MaoC family dehydratase [Bacteroidales bacterium]MDI9574032.1 hypothetical protein [Bacteroidota bacterium]OQC58909.1 MAG: hypothetical protein BWX51_01808 [Bacteroidetes bacterium ADurb.Bin012]MBP9512517.1 MaoC family dehydratase [Bacteroidales bacterium]MBP9589006.1 MaoC family dehydratase [Bacteroidales bacterium]